MHLEKTTILRIKNMVCQRCIWAVEELCKKVGLEVQNIELGKIFLAKQPSANQLDKLTQALKEKGFALLHNREEQIVSDTKSLLIDLIYHNSKPNTVKNSIYLSQKMDLSYQYLSKIFAKHEGKTIGQYIILQKIERVKELVSYNELTLSEIADQMGYSSVQHLSNQFKAIVGISVSEFKKGHGKKRQLLDMI